MKTEVLRKITIRFFPKVGDKEETRIIFVDSEIEPFVAVNQFATDQDISPIGFSCSHSLSMVYLRDDPPACSPDKYYASKLDCMKLLKGFWRYISDDVTQVELNDSGDMSLMYAKRFIERFFDKAY